MLIVFFFFNDTATTEIYTLSLHDALPISSYPLSASIAPLPPHPPCSRPICGSLHRCEVRRDRKSTRLNSSHANISYAVFCLKKKTIQCRHLCLVKNHTHLSLIHSTLLVHR